MSNLRQAAQQALNALCCLEYSFCGITDGPSDDTTEAAITALIEALAEPPQEPICPECTAKVLYECVACSNNNYPPQRKPLSDEELEVLWDDATDRMEHFCSQYWDFARAIEKAHGIKGEA